MKTELTGKKISRIGLGCMGMSEFYGPVNDAESLKALHRAFEIGYRHFDTANMYGFGHNESLLGNFLTSIGKRREEAVIATKVGIQREKSNPYKLMVKNDKSYIKKSCDESLQRLRTDYIDLYYLHRIDPNSPLEETIQALKELLDEGKIRAVGLCEVSADTIRKFHSLLPIEAVQSEYSLWTRDLEASVIPACGELGISVIAFSPLGRGFLTGKIDREFMQKADSVLDFRARLPRFNGDNLDKNLKVVSRLEEMAGRLGVAPSQIALAWILNKNKNVFVIPGTKRETYLEQNFRAQDILLAASDMKMLDDVFIQDAVHGSRYPADILAHSNA